MKSLFGRASGIVVDNQGRIATGITQALDDLRKITGPGDNIAAVIALKFDLHNLNQMPHGIGETKIEVSVSTELRGAECIAGRDMPLADVVDFALEILEKAGVNPIGELWAQVDVSIAMHAGTVLSTRKVEFAILAA